MVVTVVVWVGALLAAALGVAVVRSGTVLGVIAGLLLFVLAAGLAVTGTFFVVLLGSPGAASP